ncbi:hypothetical protein BH10PSE7_BH10PSE7_02480 [soil metagenome]
MPEVQHIHPILVHFPIVLIYTLTVIDILAQARHQDVTIRSGVGTISTYMAVACGLFAIMTWYFGGVALDVAEAGGFSSPIAETHEGLGGIAGFAFLLWGLVRLALWIRNRAHGSLAIAIPAVELAGCILVTVTAYYGGQLVYDLGVNVAKAAAGG